MIQLVIPFVKYYPQPRVSVSSSCSAQPTFVYVCVSFQDKNLNRFAQDLHLVESAEIDSTPAEMARDLARNPKRTESFLKQQPYKKKNALIINEGSCMDNYEREISDSDSFLDSSWKDLPRLFFIVTGAI